MTLQSPPQRGFWDLDKCSHPVSHRQDAVSGGLPRRLAHTKPIWKTKKRNTRCSEGMRHPVLSLSTGSDRSIGQAVHVVAVINRPAREQTPQRWVEVLPGAPVPQEREGYMQDPTGECLRSAEGLGATLQVVMLPKPKQSRSRACL